MSDSTAIIDVTFIDDETKKTFLQLKLPARQLPDTFETATTLNLGKDDWQVVEAKPISSAGFIASGSLTLRMRKLQHIDPKTILFSLPTVADEVPASIPVPVGGRAPALTLHEDDWLQLELVPAEVSAVAQSDLDAIAHVLANERKGLGFERLHIRKALPAPFSNRPLELDALVRRYGVAGWVKWTNGSAAEGAFAFELASETFLYGNAKGTRVVGLGVSRVEADVAELRADENLTLIDWCRASKR